MEVFHCSIKRPFKFSRYEEEKYKSQASNRFTTTLVHRIHRSSFSARIIIQLQKSWAVSYLNRKFLERNNSQKFEEFYCCFLFEILETFRAVECSRMFTN